MATALAVQSPPDAGPYLSGAELVARFKRLAATRGTFDSHWQEVSELALPSFGEFTGARSDGDKRHQKIYDDTAPRALSRFAAASLSYIAPPNSRYQRLAPRHRQLLRVEGVGQYYDDLTDALFGARHAPRAQFHHCLLSVLLQVGAYGNGPGFVDADPKGGLIYSALPLAQTYCELDPWGRIDRFWRKIMWTARQAALMFGRDALPAAIVKALDKEPDKKFEFLHCVYPNEKIEQGLADWRGMDYASVYVAVDGNAIVRRAGYFSDPYFMARYETGAGETYARGPCMNVLPSIKLVNAMAKAGINAAELSALPPLLMGDEAFDVFKLSPAALNPGTLDMQGRPLVQGLQLGAQPQHMLAQLQAAQKAIEDALLGKLVQAFEDTPRMSAYEAAARNQERGVLIGPMLSRLIGDVFDRITPRELDMLARQDMLPEPPQQLLDMAGELNHRGRLADARALMAYENVYVGPTQQMIKAGDVVNLQQYIEATVKLGAVFPEATLSLDAEEIQRRLADGMFVPSAVVKSAERMASDAEERRRANDAANLLGGVGAGAEAINKLAQARKAGAQADVIAAGGGTA